MVGVRDATTGWAAHNMAAAPLPAMAEGAMRDLGQRGRATFADPTVWIDGNVALLKGTVVYQKAPSNVVYVRLYRVGTGWKVDSIGVPGMGQ